METKNRQSNFILILCCFIVIITFVINYTSIFDLKTGSFKKSTSALPATVIPVPDYPQILFGADSISIPLKPTSADTTAKYYILDTQVTPQLFTSPVTNRAFSVQAYINPADNHTYLKVSQNAFLGTGITPVSFVIFDYDSGTLINQSP